VRKPVASRRHFLERCGWAATLALAAFLRLAALGDLALSPVEASQAWLPWQTAEEIDAAPPARQGPTSPLLFQLQVSVFAIVGAGDAIARWPGALAGVLLVAGAWLWRSRLGRGAALATAGLLAIDPHLVAAARHASPDGLALALGFWAVSLALVASRGDTAERAWAILLGLLATSGALGWTLLAIAFLLRGRVGGMERLAPGRTLAIAAAAALLVAGGWWISWSATPLLASGLDSWLTGWSEGSMSSGVALRSRVLLATEPLLLAVAAAGFLLLGRATARRRGLGRALALWLAASSLALFSRPGATGTIGLFVLPAAVAGGYALARATPLMARRRAAWALLIPLVPAAALELRETSRALRGLPSFAASEGSVPEARELIRAIPRSVDGADGDRARPTIAIVADPWASPQVAWLLRDQPDLTWIPTTPTGARVDPGRQVVVVTAAGERPSAYRRLRYAVAWRRAPGGAPEPLEVELWIPGT